MTNKYMLVVTGLDDKTNNQILREIFKRWSAKRCRVVYRNSKSLGWAGIEFTLSNDYNQCLEDTKKGLRIDGRVCTTKAATEEDKAYFEKKKSNFADKLLSEQQQQQVDSTNGIVNFGSLEEIKNFKFVFIDFESTVTQTGARYFPCEVGVQIYSILNGDIEHFHRFLDPGPLPLGYASQAKFTTENIHGIPWNNFKLAQKDYSLIWKELCQVICGDDPTNIPFLFAKGKDMEVGSIQNLAQRAGVENIFQVHEFEDIIKSLYNFQGVKFNSGDLSLLFPGYYDIDEQCHFHENLQKSYHCALGDVKSMRTVVKKVAELLNIIPNSKPQTVDPWANYTPSSLKSGWESIIQSTINEANREGIQTAVLNATSSPMKPQGVWAERTKNEDTPISTSNQTLENGWEQEKGNVKASWDDQWEHDTRWETEPKASPNQKGRSNQFRNGETVRNNQRGGNINAGEKRRDEWGNGGNSSKGKYKGSADGWEDDNEWKAVSSNGNNVSRGRGKPNNNGHKTNQGGKNAW